MNPYASYATTAVDSAGTNHIIWENSGQLIHATYDQVSGTWDQARPVSNATGISNLKLLSGDLIPYNIGNNTEPSYAPGLMAFWEQGQGNAKEIYAVVGRYDAHSNVVWSDAVQITQDGVGDENLDAAGLGNGLVDLVYQKSLGLDPRDPQYAVNPAQLALDAANANRDDTDLYHSFVSVVLDGNGNPGLEIFDGETVPLTFTDPSLEAAIYYPLGPGVQGISSLPPNGSPSPYSSPNNSGIQGPTASFQTGATRGFSLTFGNPSKLVDGRIGSSLFKDNFGLQLSGSLGMGSNLKDLKATLNLQISDYTKNDKLKANPDGYSRSSSVRSGSLLTLLGFSVGAINFNTSGQINYDPATGRSTGRQRSTLVNLDLFDYYKANFGSPSLSVFQVQGQYDLNIGFGVAYTFSDPKPGTNPPFTLNLPGWASGIFTGAGSGLYPFSYLSAALDWGASAAEASVIGSLGGLASNLPIIISATSIIWPPLVPWPGIDDYNKFGWGVEVPIGVKLTGTAGILNYTLQAKVVASAGITMEYQVDPEYAFLIPWQTGLSVSAQLGAFTISWSASAGGTLLNTDPSQGNTTNAFNPENLTGRFGEASDTNGVIAVNYNPYTGSSNHYQTPASRAINQSQINPTSTAQIGYVTLSNGGSDYLDGRSGSFQTYIPGSTTNDPALVTVFVNDGVITNLSVVDQGSGYGPRPLSLNLNATGGTGAAATISVQITDNNSNTGRLNQGTVTNGGSGYLGGKSGTFVISPSSSAPSSSQPLNPGLLAVTVTNGVITAINVIDPGSGYVPGQVQLDFSQNGGGGTGGVAIANPIITQLGNVVNDGPPSISSITYEVNESPTTAFSMVWVADGVTDSIPLGQQTLPLGPATTRVQTALLSGTDRSEPETIPGAGSAGFNTDPAIGFYLDTEGNPVRVVVWSHADASSLTPNGTGEEITSAILDSEIYFSVAPSDQAWSTPQALAVNSGTDTKVTLGAGSNNGELVATWVNTPLPDPTTGQTSQTIFAAVFNGQTQSWTTPSQIPNIGNATGKGIASLEVGELLGNPAIYWSDTTVPGYAYTVLQNKPDLYYRLDNQPGALVALNWASGGQTDNAQYVGTINLGQSGALAAPNGGGDPNTSAGFTGEGYVLAPSADPQSSLGDFSVEFWVNFDNLNPGQSLVDQGLYKANFVSPTATIPLTIVKTPTQQNGAWGYAYGVTILPTTQVTVTSAGSGVSPFNLDLTTLLPGTSLTLEDGTSITLTGRPALNLNVDHNVLGSITLPQASQILGTTFVANPNAQNDSTSTITLNQTLEFEAVPGWYIRTGDNQNLVFNAGGGEATTIANSLSVNTWYYVTATYNSSTQVASLYLNGSLVGQQTGSRFSPTSVPLLLGYNFQGKLDEVAYYNSLLTTNTNTVTLNSLGQANNLQTNSNGEITTHYQNRFNDPNAAEDATFYSVYNPISQAWSSPTQFSAVAANNPTNPLLKRSPVVDIVSNSSQLTPDGQPDSRVQVQLDPELVSPGVRITGIRIDSVDNPQLNWTIGNLPQPGWAIGVTVNGQLINPLNSETDFGYTVMSDSTTLDLYFQDSAIEGDLLLGQLVSVTFYTQNNSGESTPTIPITATIIPNPSSTIAQVSEAGQEQIAVGTILESEVTNLNQVDSGAILNVPNTAGQAISAGNLLNGQVGIAVSQPSANNGSGVIWLLPAGSTDTLDQINLTPLSESVPPPGGVLITNSAGSQTTTPPQIGQVLVVADVDGDGIDDLIIGAPQASNSNGSQSGNVYILSGKSLTAGSTIDLANNPGVTLIGAAGSQAGFALAAGDVNGDGYADIVVGAPFAISGGQQVGAAYLVLGGSSFFQEPTVELDNTNILLTGESGSYQDQYLNTVNWTSQVGFSVAVSGQKSTPQSDHQSLSVNGDNFADIVIGAPNYRQTVNFNGQGVNSNVSTDQVNDYKQLLTTIVNSGPGTPYSENLNTGRAYLIFGASTVPGNLTDESFNGTNGVIFDGSPILAGDHQLGFAVSTGNDVNGDGFDDVLIGAPAGNNSTGLAYIVAGGRNRFNQAQSVLSYQANFVLGGSGEFSYLGKTLSLAGDLNGDGMADLVLGSPNAEYSTGEAHILFGADNLLGSTTPIYQSLQPGASSGVMKLSGGIVGGLAAGAVWSGQNLNGQDSNGKSYDSLIVSAPFSGELYVVYGHEWLTEDGNLKLTNLAGNNGLIIDGTQLSNTFAEDQVEGETDTSPSLVSSGDTLYLAVKGLNNTDLYVSTSSNGGDTWSPFAVAIAGATNVSPTLAVYNDVIYMAYTGLFPELNILQSTDGESWSQQSVISEFSNNAPTLVVYQDQLLLFYTSSTNSDIYYVYSSNPEDPSSWSDPVHVTINGSGSQTSSTPVSVAVLNNKLYLLYQQGTITSPTTGAYGLGVGTLASNNPTDLSDLTWNYTPITLEEGAVGNVGLTADSSQLYLTYRNQQDQIYVNTSVNGQDWRNPIEVPNQASGYAPSPALLNNQLYLGYGGTNEDIIVTSTALPVLGNMTGNPTQLLGDINGDGFADILMGGGNASLITFGNGTEALLDESIGTGDLVLTLSNGGFQDVFAIGDFNGDTFQDTGIVDNNSNFYLLYGSATLGTTGLLSLNPESISTTDTFNFGAEVGDLNGDGFADLILGFQRQDSESSNFNTLYLAFGNASGTVNPQKLNIVANTTVEAAGDVNGDGIDDLILGDPFLNSGAGAFYVLLGSPELSSDVSQGDSLSVASYLGTPQLLVQSSGALEWEGAQQVNVNANFNIDGTGNPGISTVVFGDEIISLWSSNMSSADGYEMNFSRASVNSPTTWSQASSLPNNWASQGIPDLTTFNNDLYAFWYYGGNGASSAAFYYSQYQGNGQWGDLVSTNLTNNDLKISNGLESGINLIEYDDALYAIWQGTGNDEGNALFYSFSPDGQNWQTPMEISGAAAYQAFNVPTLAVFQGTLFAYFSGFGGQGIYYSTYNKANSSWSDVQLISNLTANNNALTPYGLSIINVEDEILYAAWTIDSNPINGNPDYSIYISASTDGVNWDIPSSYSDIYGWGIPSLYLVDSQLSVLSPGANDKDTSTADFLNSSSQNIISPLALGSTVAAVGDVNGDGYGDAVIFTPFYNDPNSGTEGAAYLQFGSATGFDPTASTLFTGVNLPDAVISKAGDVNGDGLDDFLISSSSFANELGITYVVFGASNLSELSSLDLGALQPVSTSSGQIVDGKLGRIQLSDGGSGYLSGGGGTFNILVTSSTSTEAGIIQATVSGGVITGVKVTNPGAGFTSASDLQYTYLETGGSGANVSVTSLVSLAGFQIIGLENSLSGQSLSGGGDVNGDGFDDITIGAPGDDLSYILFGGDFTASVNQSGSLGDDSLEGTATGDVIIGEPGDDVLLGNGGLDVLLGGAGNDWLQVQDINFRRVDGGSGTDALALYGYNSQAWDLTTLAPGSRIRNIESIDVRNYGGNLLTLNQASILKMTDTRIMTINGDSSDKINLSPDFTRSRTEYVDGRAYIVYQSEAAEAWINSIIPTANISFTAPNANSPSPLPQALLTAVTSNPIPVSPGLASVATSTSQDTQFVVSSPVVAENGQALVFTVIRSGNLGEVAAARYRTLNASSLAGVHYDAQAGYVVFEPNETVKEVVIAIKDDHTLGPRQREVHLGLVPLSTAAATLLSNRTLSFTNEPGTHLRNLGTSSVGLDQDLSKRGGLPFAELNFNVSAPGGKTTLVSTIHGISSLNSFFRLNPTTQEYEEFLYDGNTGVELLDTNGDNFVDTLTIHLVDGGRGDSDGVVNGVVAGFSAPAQVTPGPIEVNPGVFFIPTTSDGALQFHNVTAQGVYRFGVFEVDDSQGRIGNLLPSDPGYSAAAHARQQTIFQNASASNPNALTSSTAQAAFTNPQLLAQSEFQANGAFQAMGLTGNRHYGLFLSQDGQTHLSTNDSDFKAKAVGRGYFDLRWSNTQFEIGTPILVTPGQAGQTINANFELARGGAYNNTLALFQVDCLTGGLDQTGDGLIDVRPGDATYLQAVLERIQDPLTGKILPKVPTIFTTQSKSIDLPGAELYGMALITDGSLEQFLEVNPSNSSIGSKHILLSFDAANPGGVSYVRRLGDNVWGFEDIFGGGDRDYNDMVLQFSLPPSTIV